MMSKDPVTIDNDSSVAKALSLMERNNVKQLPVVSGKMLEGLISLHSIITYRRYTDDLKVEKLMIKPPSISENDELLSALKLIHDSGVQGLPVTREGELTGFISNYDIIKSLRKEFKDVEVKALMREAPPSLKKSDTAAKARKLMYYNKVTSLPVGSEELIGVLRESDFSSLYKPREGMGYGVEGKGDSDNFLNIKVGDILVKPYESAVTSDKASKLINLMLDKNRDSLIVVDKDDKPVGYVDFFELIRHLYQVRWPKVVLLNFSGMELDFPTNALLTKVIRDHIERVNYLAKDMKTIKVHIKGVHSGGGTRKYELTLKIVLKSGVMKRVQKVGYALRECLDEALTDIERIMKKEYKR